MLTLLPNDPCCSFSTSSSSSLSSLAIKVLHVGGCRMQAELGNAWANGQYIPMGNSIGFVFAIIIAAHIYVWDVIIPEWGLSSYVATSHGIIIMNDIIVIIPTAHKMISWQGKEEEKLMVCLITSVLLSAALVEATQFFFWAQQHRLMTSWIWQGLLFHYVYQVKEGFQNGFYNTVLHAFL